VFVIGLATLPMQPYATGSWDGSTLVVIGVVGLAAAAVGRGAEGLAGVVVGAGAGVAFLLFVLASQAAANQGVVASVPEPPWSELAARALLVGLAVVVAAYLLGAGIRWLAGRGAGPTARAEVGWRSGALVLGATAVTVIVVGASLAGVARSAYVTPGVAAPAAAVSETPNDGGLVVGVGALLGSIVAGWSAAGSTVLGRRRRRGGAPETPADLRAALIVGTFAALLLAGWALFAIDLARNPF
jgi:hypothetical protein